MERWLVVAAYRTAASRDLLFRIRFVSTATTPSAAAAIAVMPPQNRYGRRSTSDE